MSTMTGSDSRGRRRETGGRKREAVGGRQWAGWITARSAMKQGRLLRLPRLLYYLPDTILFIDREA